MKECFTKIFFDTSRLVISDQNSPRKMVLRENKQVSSDLQIIEKMWLNEDALCMAKNAQKLKNIILKSDLSKVFILLTNELNPENRYKSDSEADWSFCLLLLSFMDINQLNKVKVIEYLVLYCRAPRDKLFNERYRLTTIVNALKYAEKYGLIGSQLTKSKKKIMSAEINQIKKSLSILVNTIEKSAVVKICNAMKIFHLGRSVNNLQIVSDQEGNYLKATIPTNLNQTDFAYYMEILYRYKQQLQYAYKTYGYASINMSTILLNLGKNTSGSSYKDLYKSLSKLAAVTLEYDKKINSDTMRHKRVESLLDIDLYYSNERNNCMQLFWL
uniref:Uncharacterized protein n=1 Tax=Melanthalia intermedia TaxID=172989 RepID=A0A345UAN9_9FLOR|nr:hypothetical protein [Melanthalia intermedia]AXI97525.1 hypothetical protein [Melanthalia intermedia]